MRKITAVRSVRKLATVLGVACWGAWLAGAKGAEQASPSARVADEKTLVEWRFDREGDFRGWTTFGMIADEGVRGGSLRGRATGSDPILMGPVFEIAAGPLQYVEIDVKATADTYAELYWTETLDGEYGGFSPAKYRQISVKGDGQFHAYRVWPFWHMAKKIIRLRLDPPNLGTFEIRSIRIREQKPTTAHLTSSWKGEEVAKRWQACGDAASPADPILLSPLVSISAEENPVVCVRMATTRSGSGRLFCVSRGRYGWEVADFRLRPDGRMHSYNIDASSLENWRGEIILLGLKVPGGAEGGTRIESIEVAPEPRGPADIDVHYFGAAEGISRAGRPTGVTCTLVNLGGENAEQLVATLEAPQGVQFLDAREKTLDRLSPYLPKTLSWKIQSGRIGKIPLALTIRSPRLSAVSSTAAIELTEAPKAPKAPYVPEPRPVRSRYEVGAFYFPGWPSTDNWRPILDYPNRKPILGWYDEANPECVDWQIKWAVEHGVSFFMVDWYWCQGNRHLEHWLHKGYAKARYRKYLKWAVMWANHNPPNTHSREDWRKVTKYWIDHCFSMPEYYRIDNRPAVFLWAPENVRRDLGGSSEAAKLYALSQEMARAAGYPGIYFVAMSGHDTPERAKELRGEGFEAVTTYHGFELARLRAGSDQFPFAGVLETSPEFWRQQDRRATGMLSIPTVDTGWDARPWHGEKSMVAHGRTPELFGQLCREARRFADANGKKILALGPWNEWGEGSYIEPCAEHGFRDLDELREALCEPGDWPPNLVPADVGLGPYDLPPEGMKTTWEFNTDGDAEGWTANGDVADLEVKGGLLTGRSTGRDPVLSSTGFQVEADRVRRLSFRMRSDAPGSVQIFFATKFTKMGEPTARVVDVPGDRQFHEYEVDLGENPRWRGLVTALRFDPATRSGQEFAIDYIRLHPGK